MFERFNDKAIQVILLAQLESRRLEQNFVGPEQMLIGLILEGTSWAAIVLRESGLTLPFASEELEKIVGRGTGFVGRDLPFTPIARQVLEQANEEASKFAQEYIGPEHLLLGLIQEPGTARMLQNLGIDLDQVQAQVIRIINKPVAVGTKIVPNRETQRSRSEALSEFGTNLNQLATEDKNRSHCWSRTGN